METRRSGELFEEANHYIPGGVNSPVRAFKAVQGTPLFIERGQGAKIFDVDGNEFIDYVGSWGPLILGHRHPEVTRTVLHALEKGTSFGAPTELEVAMAKQVVKAVPSVEQVRMVSSGTEAVMSAIRLARGFTGREKVVKFEGCYHGHSDMLLSEAGSGVITLGIPGSPGVTKGAAADTINLPYNNIGKVETLVSTQGEQIAAIIVEPIAGNMGVIPPKQGFLEKLRELCTSYGIVLIFDEVITGFRVSYGGAQERFGIEPDLTCLGKIIGGGFPVGAFGGKQAIMQKIAPTGDVYQAGTLSGNPVAMASGLATLQVLENPDVYRELEKKSARLSEGLKESAEQAGVPTFFTRVGAMSCLFFNEQEVANYEDAKKSDTQRYSRYFWKMLEQGVYLAPSQFEATFVSLAHTDGDIERTIEAAQAALATL